MGRSFISEKIFGMLFIISANREINFLFGLINLYQLGRCPVTQQTIDEDEMDIHEGSYCGCMAWPEVREISAGY